MNQQQKVNHYKTFVAGLTLAGLLTVASNPLRAQSSQGGGVPITLNITATASVQGADNGGDPVDKITAGKLKINTLWFLQKIAAAKGTNLPVGAKLVLQPDTSVFVTDNKGSMVIDASVYFFIVFDQNSQAVWQGQKNTTTGQESYTGTYLSSISFDDGTGNSIMIQGLTTEKYSLTATDQNSNQTGSESIIITGAGDGTVLDNLGNTPSVAITAKITASGKGLANH